MLDDKPRLRISAKQTAKNLWQLDATIEFSDEVFQIDVDPEDMGIEVKTTLGKKLLELIKDTEKEFRAVEKIV